MSGRLGYESKRWQTVAALGVAALSFGAGCSGGDSGAEIPPVEEGIDKAYEALCSTSDVRDGLSTFISDEFDDAPESVREAFLDADLSVQQVADAIPEVSDLADDDDLVEWLEYVSESGNLAAKRYLENASAGAANC